MNGEAEVGVGTGAVVDDRIADGEVGEDVEVRTDIDDGIADSEVGVGVDVCAVVAGVTAGETGSSDGDVDSAVVELRAAEFASAVTRAALASMLATWVYLRLRAGRVFSKGGLSARI